MRVSVSSKGEKKERVFKKCKEKKKKAKGSKYRTQTGRGWVFFPLSFLEFCNSESSVVDIAFPLKL